MKTNKTLILASLIATVCAGLFFSCEGPIGLGENLDIQGPIVEFTAPIARKSLGEEFVIEGTASDRTGIKEVHLKAEINNRIFAKQWRYNGERWEEQINGGSWTAVPGAKWIGSNKSASWTLPINMKIEGSVVEQGEYQFILQAWDTGNFTDENSYKTRVFIFDKNPPKVDVSEPYLYRFFGGSDYLGPGELNDLHSIDDDGDEKTNPEYIGKFLTQSFQLKWQIEDNGDIRTIDLRFYEHDVPVDDDLNTPLPQNYIYRYVKDIPPEQLNPQNSVRPNGSVTVPALTSSPGYYDGGAELKLQIEEKTTIKIVALCYDAAGNFNQEKTLGYFIYWPAADKPWIKYSDGMETLSYYADKASGQDLATLLDEDAFMIYPGREIMGTAYHAHGVEKVTYSLYQFFPLDNGLSSEIYLENNSAQDYFDEDDKLFYTKKNTKRPNGDYPTILPWKFKPPARSGYFIVKAKAYSKGNESVVHEALFRVQDITFPDFPDEPSPKESTPLYKAIKNKPAGPYITISGTLSDATEVDSLTMVWINPQSVNYSAMSQLQYFRDQSYAGWEDAKTVNLQESKLEPSTEQIIGGVKYPFDKDYPNRLWNLRVDKAPNYTDSTGKEIIRDGVYLETNRQAYVYSIDIMLSELNIGIGAAQQPLKSQMFLLRAENPGKKCTIITYAPQGDESPPEIEITDIRINGGNPIIHGDTGELDQFVIGNTIVVNGVWREDSVLTDLDLGVYFKNVFIVNIGDTTIGSPNVTKAAGYNFKGGKVADGPWTITANVGSNISVDKLKDVLVISANVRDIGGGKSDTSSSWLIKSDTLRLNRISSTKGDGIYNEGKIITFFLEFNKPVQLTNSGSSPVLTLNAGAGAVATYSTTENDSISTRQIFEYKVLKGHNINYLDVTGLQTSVGWESTATGSSGYPFTWHRNDEQIRITTVSSHTGAQPEGKNFYARKIPTADYPSDYQYTLRASKEFTIDTTPPKVDTRIEAKTPIGHYKENDDIYIAVTFDKEVKTGIPLPQLLLNTKSSGYGLTDTGDISVNEKTITFKYKVVAGDSTEGNPIIIEGYRGIITDTAGTAHSGGELGGGNFSFIEITIINNRTLSGRYVNTIPPVAPIVRILPGQVQADDSNVVENTVNGQKRTGKSTAATVDLVNLYNNTLYFSIQRTTAQDYMIDRFEYSIDDGENWSTLMNINNTPVQLTQQGNYDIIARQVDKSGNKSDPTKAISFNWDPGVLITRISSTSANGTYTHNTGRNSVNITVTFRKPLNFLTGTPVITLNARNSNSFITVNGSTGSTTNALSFTYLVSNGDYTPTSGATQVLDVTGISGFTSVRDAQEVEVSALLNNILPQAEAKLAGNKQIKVETGNLIKEDLKFENDTSTGLTQGIQADGSYWTTLHIRFNHTIYKNNGTITIEQIAGSGNTAYRLPAVLTEAQYGRFRGVADFNTYYTKGTNGYLNAQGRSDTSTKYVLNYQFNPNSAVVTNDSAFTGDRPIPSGFFTAFRQAEIITINVNSQAVEQIGNTLKVRLTGSNAPQVPGATYQITYPAGLVTDSLGNSSEAAAAVAENQKPLEGVAKPFVRIKKTNDIISADTTRNDSTARLTANQPAYAYVRMDSRTPNSEVVYRFTGTPHQVNAVNWSESGGPAAGPAATRPDDPTGGAVFNSSGSNNGMEIGNNLNQGYKWWVRAKARIGSSTYTYSSDEAEEMAYRTAITYVAANISNNIGGSQTTGQQNMGMGDQIWIRGGDSIGSSSIPGFPFTWEDDFSSLEANKKRAGIRLMTKGNGTLNNSTWQFLTWEMNAIAYIDFILGRDGSGPTNGTNPDIQVDGNGTVTVGPSGNQTKYPASTVQEAWQYGPCLWAYQRSGWSSLKTQYRINPGEHRWLSTSSPSAVNFSSAFKSRPFVTKNSVTGTLTVTHPNPNAN